MRPACIALLVILAATSLAAAKSTTTIMPQSIGTIAHFPIFGITQVQGSDLQSACFVTTESNLEYRRSFMEFSIPSFGRKEVTSATLIITDNNGAIVNPAPPPDVHEVSYYAADLIVDVSDYNVPTTLVGTLETWAGEADVHEISFDVTDIVREFEGESLGFRIKLEIDPTSCPTVAGSDFGGPFNFPPRLVIKTKPGRSLLQ